jgi:hypothetical protein
MRTGKRAKKTRSRWSKSDSTIRLTGSERRVLEHLCRAGRTGTWVVARARCVLLAARGRGTKAIARAVGRAPHWVRHWRERFARDRLNGLIDRERSGRPARFSPRGTA